MRPDAPARPGQLAQAACLLEATARKPGNVHPERAFDDAHFLDFALSALAIGPALERAATEGVGVAVLAAVQATRSWVGGNTNLGMILLLAPLAAVPPGRPLDSGVKDVLQHLTLDDARRVFEAIRTAAPGGLGRAEEQDVSDEPSIGLVDAMGLAAGRDSVALQYANGFAEVFGLALPALARATAEGRGLETAIVLTHLTLMARLPDTLIARKRGRAEATEAAARASRVLTSGWPDRAAGRAECAALDAWLRSVGHERNPGTTADLVAAALFAALRDGTIAWPVRAGRGAWCPPGSAPF